MVLYYVRIAITEAIIVLKYSWFPAVLNLLLSSVNWNYATVISLIKLFVFVQMIHNEDQKTSSLHVRVICFKLAVAVSLYIFTYLGLSTVEENLPESFAHYVGSSKIKLSKARAKSILMTQNSRNVSSKAKYFVLRVLAEYLLMCNSMAHYRICYLGLVFVIYGTFKVIIWYYLPDEKDEDDSDDSGDSDNGLVNLRDDKNWHDNDEYRR